MPRIASEVSNFEKVSCVVPTKDRPYFVDRLLYYMSIQGIECPIIIADSSSTDNFTKLRKIVSAYNLSNIVLLKYDEKIEFYDKVSISLNYVKSKYFYMCADDDYIFKSGVSNCIDELERDDGLAAAVGELLIYNFDSTVNQSPFLPHSLTTYPAKTEVASKLHFRIANHFEKYSPTFYSVYRTESAKNSFSNTTNFSCNMRTAEIISSAFLLMEGGRKVVSSPFGLRTSHKEALHRELSPLATELSKKGVLNELSNALEFLANEIHDKESLNSEISIGALKEKFIGAFYNWLRSIRMEEKFCFEIYDRLMQDVNDGKHRAKAADTAEIVETNQGSESIDFPSLDKGELFYSLALSEVATFGFRDGVSRGSADDKLREFESKSIISSTLV